MIYTLLHLLVDFAGIYFLVGVGGIRVTSHGQWLAAALLYNLTAFALPMPLGLLADRWGRDKMAAAVGYLLVLAGYLLPMPLFPAVFMIGTGNGIFHLGAGIGILRRAGDRYALPGVFISTGALGVWLGLQLGRSFFPLDRAVSVLVALGALVLLAVCSRSGREERAVESRRVCLPPVSPGFLYTVCGVSSVVFLRAYYGTLLNYPWRSDLFPSFMFAMGVVLGKGVGGLLADRIGAVKTVTGSLGIAGILAAFSFRSPLCGVASVFFFNMTMPVTLLLMSRLFGCCRGFAFGILTFSLFLGTLPGLMGAPDLFFSRGGLPVLCMVSMAVLVLSILKGKDYFGAYDPENNS